MSPIPILFDADGHAVNADEISERIKAFGDGYNDPVKRIIDDSRVLDEDGAVFISSATRILSSFGMSRRGAFYGDKSGPLRKCWDKVGTRLMSINKAVLNSGLPRGRYLLELGERDREALIAEMWLITKALLPFTMGATSYGLVGASKILFSVLPEIVLPVDNSEWLHVFQTVDLGDVLRFMVAETAEWEGATGTPLDELDPSGRLTTLPSVYNVMAMYARP